MTFYMDSLCFMMFIFNYHRKFVLSSRVISCLFLFRFTWLISPIVDGIFMMKLLWYIFVLLDSHSSHCYSFLLTNWRVIEYHVDGFRFDLASVLCRGTDGSPLNAPPIIRVSHVYTFKYILSKQMTAT